MKKNKFNESGKQHTFVIYILLPVLLVVILNAYLFNNLFYSIILSSLILIIYHCLIGYRFYKSITLNKDSIDLKYPYSFMRKNEIILLYENFSKVKVIWGFGSNQEFIKFYIGNRKIKFVSNDWDIKDIILIMSNYCDNQVFDLNACKIINKQKVKENLKH